MTRAHGAAIICTVRRGPYEPRSPLASHRHRHRLTLEQAAAQLGIPRAYLNKVELGAVHASISLRRRLARLYALELADVNRMLSIVEHLAFDRLRRRRGAAADPPARTQFARPKQRRRRAR